jgi:hypothetical protein
VSNWTEKDIEFLINNHATLTNIDLAKKLNRTVGSIESRITKIGLGRHYEWTKEEDDILKEHFEFNSHEFLMDKLHRSWRGIMHRADKLGMHRAISANYSNISFFNTWSNEMAYVLGFVAADGCVYSSNNGYDNKSLQINLSYKDVLHLEKIRDLLAPNKVISVYYEHNKNGKTYKHCALSMGSDYMCDRLVSLGIGERKSLVFEFPFIPEQYISHFVRGYFDGDGCIKKRKNSVVHIIDIIGTESFLSSLSSIIDTKFGFSKRTIQKKTNSDMYYINYTTLQVAKICAWMYQDSTIHLDRKHDKYLKLVKRLNKDKNTDYRIRDLCEATI